MNREEMHEQAVLESKLGKFIRSEIGFIITLVVFIFGVVVPYFQIRQDIALIQKDISIINSNHEQHIQDILQEISAMKKEQQVQRETLILLLSRNGYDTSKINFNE